MKRTYMIAICMLITLIFAQTAIAAGKDHILQIQICEDEVIVFSDFNLANSNHDLKFTLNEEPVPFEKQRRFRMTNESMATLYVVDESASLKAHKNEIVTFLNYSINKMTNSDMAGIMLFSETVRMQSDFTRDSNTLHTEADLIAFDSDGDMYITEVLTAARKALLSKEGLPGKKQIILISDGEKKPNQGPALTALYTQSQTAPIPVYTIGVETNFTDSERLSALSEFSSISNGEFWPLGNEQRLANKIDELIRDAWYIPLKIDGFDRDGSQKELRASYLSQNNERLEMSIFLRMPIVTRIVSTETEFTADPQATAKPEEQGLLGIGDWDGLQTVIIIFGIRSAFWAWLVFFITMFTAIALFITYKQKRGFRLFTWLSKTSKTHDTANKDKRISQKGTELLDSLFVLMLKNIATSEEYQIKIDREIVIGFDSKVSDIVIDSDKTISSKHCQVYCRRDKVYITDLHSSNHTYVNGAEVFTSQIQEIKSGDNLKLGQSVFRVMLEEIK